MRRHVQWSTVSALLNFSSKCRPIFLWRWGAERRLCTCAHHTQCARTHTDTHTHTHKCAHARTQNHRVMLRVPWHRYTMPHVPQHHYTMLYVLRRPSPTRHPRRMCRPTFCCTPSCDAARTARTLPPGIASPGGCVTVSGPRKSRSLGYQTRALVQRHAWERRLALKHRIRDTWWQEAHAAREFTVNVCRIASIGCMQPSCQQSCM